MNRKKRPRVEYAGKMYAVAATVNRNGILYYWLVNEKGKAFLIPVLTISFEIKE